MNTSTSKATIEERGNGFPDVGDYVPGDDGNLYKVVTMHSQIITGNGSGTGSYIHATVELADWSDCEEGDEHPSCAVLEDEA